MEEAEAYYTRYAVTMADHAAVDAHMAGKKEFSQSHDAHAYDRYRQRFAGGAGTYPLIGTPEKIAEEMIAIAAQGYEGIALSFVNYTQELPYFCDRVLPLLRKAGYGSSYFAGLASGFVLSTTNTLIALAGTLPMLFTSCFAPAGIM